MDAVSRDKRFAVIAKDPRFHRMKRKDRKVTIDKRFHGMFNDKRFKLKYTVDKRGRPVRTTTDENLQKYYDLSDEEDQEEGSDSEDEEEGNIETVKKSKREKQEEFSSKKESKSKKSAVNEKVDKKSRKEVTRREMVEESSEEEKQPSFKSKKNNTKETSKKSKRKVEEEEEIESSEEKEVDDTEEEGESSDEEDEEGIDLARGVGNVETSSSSEEEESEDCDEDLARGEGNIETSSDEAEEEESEEEELDHKWGELHENAPEAPEITCRLAVCNMDWDNVKANDIFVLLNSFKPIGGVIKSVSVYPSEFGKQRMAEEDVRGPKELVASGPVENEEDCEEGSVAQREKMRQYQLKRLMYYYAVVECESPETANGIYEQCDGIEYESSGTRIDLRFIPNDMQFEDTPTSVATSMPEGSKYKPKHFVTTALQQSKVELTWDETDKDRTAVTMRKFTKEDMEDLDMKDYLASSESEADEDPYANFLEKTDFEKDDGKEENDDKVLEEYNEMIKMAKGKGKKEKKEDDGMEISWDPGLNQEAENKKLKKSEGNETPWQKYLEQKKERKKKSRQKKKLETDGVKSEETTESTTKKKTKKPKEETRKEDSESGDDDSDKEKLGEEEEAFSDDDLPSDIDMEDDFFKEELGQESKGSTERKKTKKNKKGTSREDDPEVQKQKAELALLMDDDDNRQHFNLKDIMEKEGMNLSKTKRKKLKKLKKKQEQKGEKIAEDTFNVDVTDPRFDDLFKNPLYNIDPSASEFKATKATDALIQEKLRRRQLENQQGKSSKAKKRPSEADIEGTPAKKQTCQKEDKTPSKDTSLATLIKSVKAKTQTIQQKKRR